MSFKSRCKKTKGGGKTMMKIYFNNGFKVRPVKQLSVFDFKDQKEASENISNICARLRHREFARRFQ